MEGRKVRLRLIFERRRMLPKPLRRDGLRRCWLLLHPGLATIADLSCYIFHTFQLHNACPNGIILSMEDYILPSFESTGIFKDKDTISVRSTAGALKQFLGINDVECCVCKRKGEEEAFNYQQNKCSLFNGMLLLDAPLREVKTSKRKSLHEHMLCNSMRKKLKVSGTTDQMVIPASAEACMDQNKCHLEERITDENVIGSSSDGNRNMEEKNVLKDAEGKNKSPSRNFEMKKRNLLLKQHRSKDNEAQLSVRNKRNMLLEREMLDHSGAKEGESIPTMTEHCHNDDAALENNSHQGQKQTLPCKETFSKLTSQDQGNEKINSSHDGEPCKTTVVQKNKPPTCQINFEDLYPLTRLPKEGDILVYRLFQSSPLLGPELSSFRVGKVTSYDAATTKIVLNRISGYPLLPKNVPYKEDGSLEIDYPELVDVRLLNNDMETTRVTNLEPAQGSREYAGWANNKRGQASGWGGTEGQENSWGRRDEQQNGLGRKEGQENGWGTKEGQRNGWVRKEGQENGWGTKEVQQNGWVRREGQENGWGTTDGQENAWNGKDGQESGWNGKDGQENGWGAWPRIKPRKTSWQDQVNNWCTASQMPNYDGWGSQHTQRTSASSSWASGQRGRGARGSPGFRGRERGGRSRGRGGRGGRSQLGA